MTAEQIREKLMKTYPDAEVEVVDTTGTMDHFDVVITTDSLKGMSRIQQHKAIMGVFADELKSGEIHAFSLKTGTF